MNEREIGKFFKVTLIAQLAMCLAIVWDVPVARQVIGFIYLSFIPGFVLLGVFRIYKTNLIEVILLSVGLSIAFLMFVGLLVNEIYPLLGILNPLSPQPLLTTIIGITLVLSALAHFINLGFSNHVSTGVKFNKSVLLLFCLPLVSIVGAISLDNASNNSISLLVVIFIAGLIIFGITSKKTFSSRSYPAALLAIAVSLLFLLSFTSLYIIGYDIPLEYYVFNLAKTSFHWNPVFPSGDLISATYNSMLSITILPTIYSYMLGMSSTLTLKIIYPLIFSLVPLGLYQIYRKQVEKRIAFLSAFFFLSFSTFFDQMLGLTRQMIAELFFVLLILLLLDKKIDRLKRTSLCIIFGAALITSHYSVSYMFAFLVLVALLFLPKIERAGKERNGTLDWHFCFIFLIMTLLWYTYTSGSAPLIAVTRVGQQISNNIFIEFLNPAARSHSVIETLGTGSSISPIHEIGRRVFQLAQLFVVVGFIRVIFKRREMKFDPEYFLMSLTSMAVLILCIVLPYLAGSLEMTRIYHLTLIFLAPFFVLGGEVVFGWLPMVKRFKLQLTSIFLVTFFLFQSGFVYEVTGDIPSWGALSKHRIHPLTNMALYVEYIHQQDVFSVSWLSQNNGGVPKIYADRASHYHVLTSYGMLPIEYQRDWAYLLSNSTKNVDEGAYIYLGNLNVVHGIAEGPKPGLLWNITEISPLLDKCNRIYSNGGSDIYKQTHN